VNNAKTKRTKVIAMTTRDVVSKCFLILFS
jgi:hypothetical protein